MEASKCPKCGDEPHFVETVEKWYCYGCNEYIDNEATVESEKPAAETTHEHVDEAAHEHEVPEDSEAVICSKCGAELEKIKDGKLYCFICEEYPGEPASVTKPDPAQAILDSIPSPVPAEKPVVPIAEPVREEVKAVALPEPVPEKPLEIKMCSTCGQPLKYIEKYKRDYCYGCRKYAPREDVAKPEPVQKPSATGSKECPTCHGALRFIEKYGEYYCFSCKSYPLRVKKSSPAKNPNSCPKCGGQLKYIEKYQRHYCNSCKEYAPKGHGSHAPSEKKVCPACSSEMKYVAEYNEWYCYKCKKYSLRPSKPVLLF